MPVIYPEPRTLPEQSPEFIFYLGTHIPIWLTRTSVPLFISRTRLTAASLPVARGPWALDSGAYSELSRFGRWTITAEQYVKKIRLYVARIGKPDFCAPMDSMCEPWIIKKTGRTVREHLEATVSNFVRLIDIAPDLPIVPSVQGYRMKEYELCLRMYEDAGIDLTGYEPVGVGSVCRRQNTTEIFDIVTMIRERGISCHGFGVKIGGLARYGKYLYSADSLAWSYAARANPNLEGRSNCRDTHINCANCLPFALQWRKKVIDEITNSGFSGYIH